MKTKRLCALALAVLLSGCMQDAPNKPEGSGTTTVSPSGSQSATGTLGPNIPVPDYPTAIRFTECVGFVAGATYPVPGTMGAQQDPYWDAPLQPLSMRYHIDLYDCARVSVGPFERPLRLLVETHGYTNPPESCYPVVPTGGSATMAILVSVWVNDTEVGEWLRANYGMPVYVSDITELQTPQLGYLERAWSWGLEGQKRSNLKFIDDDLPLDSFEENFRYFWFNETAVNAMDFDRDYDLPAWSNRYAYGTLAPPMLGANFNENYASNGDWLPGIRPSATVTMFKDHFCTEPA